MRVRFFLLAACCHFICVFHRHQQDNVVIDIGLDAALAPTVPLGDLNRFPVVTAAEEADIAVVVHRRLDVDADDGVLAMGKCDLLMRDFDEVRAMQHPQERADHVLIGAFDHGGIEAHMTVELGIEIEIVVAQPFELVVIFVVKDRSEQSAELAKIFALLLAAQRSLLDQGVQDIALSDRNEMIPSACSASSFAHVPFGRGWVPRPFVITSIVAASHWPT